jgi:hypothetical protein
MHTLNPGSRESESGAEFGPKPKIYGTYMTENFINVQTTDILKNQKILIRKYPVIFSGSTDLLRSRPLDPEI